MNNQKNAPTPKTKKHSHQLEDPGLTNLDSFTSNAKLSRFDALLYFFEDHGAVIKMIIKGRSPTTRNVSRTHRVAFDGLFDRINLDPKIKIKYVDTKTILSTTQRKAVSPMKNGTIFSVCSIS